jgi:hypothetical protein
MLQFENYNLKYTKDSTCKLHLLNISNPILHMFKLLNSVNKIKLTCCEE